MDIQQEAEYLTKLLMGTFALEGVTFSKEFRQQMLDETIKDLQARNEDENDTTQND